ncbi:hypothetical protein MKX62_03785 [Sporosarcina sp. FSL K6-5500]
MNEFYSLLRHTFTFFQIGITIDVEEMNTAYALYKNFWEAAEKF